MYLHIKDIMINDSRVAEKLPTPIWVDKHGTELSNEEGACGCKTDVKITHPDMIIMFDEVGSNLSQEGDHVNGVEKHLFSLDKVLYQSMATKNTHFITLGITRLDGHPLMCVTIRAGKKRDVSVERGINWDKIKDVDNIAVEKMDPMTFPKNNFGEDSYCLEDHHATIAE